MRWTDVVIHFAQVASALSLSGCFWEPANGSVQEDDSALRLEGWGTQPNALVDIRALDHTTGGLVLVASPRTRSTETYVGSGLYPWVQNITLNQRRFWAPTTDLGLVTASTGGFDGSIGRIELQAFEGDTQLFTFSGGAQVCTISKMAEGETQMNAGAACYDGRQVAVFDNSGVGRAPEPLSFASREVREVGDPRVQVEVVSYVSDGAPMFALVCRPLPTTPPTRRPSILFNHGGSIGVFEATANRCVSNAQQGFVWAHSAYRGEPLVVPAAWGFSSSRFTSGGRVEVSLGEVKDVLRLLALMRAQDYVDPAHVLMWGHSHGGAITLRAVQQGAAVTGAVAVAPATDWAQVHDDCRCTIPLGCACSGSTTCIADPELVCPLVVNGSVSLGVAPIATTLGGTPASNAVSYSWRSPLRFATDLSIRKDVKLLIQQGVADSTVRYSQVCRLSRAAFADEVSAWRVTSSGSTSTTALSGCDVRFASSARPGTSPWANSRTILFYDAAGHALHEASAWATADFTNFFNYGGW